jgi:hypothetical protein
MTTIYTRERTLQEEIAPLVEGALPEVEVLASERCGSRALRAGHGAARRLPRGVHDRRLVARPGAAAAHAPTFRVRDRTAGRARTSEEIAGRSRYRGTVLDASDEAVTVSVAQSEPLRIPYDTIVRANLIDEGLTT